MKCSISPAGRGIQKMGLLIFCLAMFAIFVAQPLSAREYDMRKPLAHVQPSASSPSGDEDPYDVTKSIKSQNTVPQNINRFRFTRFLEQIYYYIIGTRSQISTSHENSNDNESASSTTN